MLESIELNLLENYVVWFKDLSIHDTQHVGGKNASLGEMLSKLSRVGIKIPQGFAITTKAYYEFLSQNNLQTEIDQQLNNLQVDNFVSLKQISKNIKDLILLQAFPKNIEESIRAAFEILTTQINKNMTVAVRSSATAEDSKEASFAGQQETYLNVCGFDNLLLAIKQVFASLFSERALSYRMHHGIAHKDMAISVGVQQMVRSDCGVSGVMFTLDTESGFDKVILINASYGLGELLVQGSVNPDEFYVYKDAIRKDKRAIIHKHLGSKQYKMVYADEQTASAVAHQSEKFAQTEGENQTLATVPVPPILQKEFSLTDVELEFLAKQALLIEEHYGSAMDIEWAKDGISGELYILQARPETVKSRASIPLMPYALELYELNNNNKVPALIQGRSVGNRINQGTAKVITSINDIAAIKPGDVLVTDMTDPNWEPIMKRAAAIVTNRGGRTCHAAIIARELGIPAVVGCGNATECIQSGQEITVSCAEGDIGYVYPGKVSYEVKRFDLERLPKLPVKIMMTIANPERAFDFQRLPNGGVGLARLEFIINQNIGIHPKACLEFQKLNPELQKQIKERIIGYQSPVHFYVEKLTEGIATLAAAFWPKPVIVRLSDFKSNEYENLLGGQEFEPKEENPMIGFRGASRYLSPTFRDCFALECQALKIVREDMGLTNVEVMIPFVRTPLEAKQTVEALASEGLKRGENDLRIIMMCEIPSNALLASDFLQYLDGFSIGSNDLTQLTLGLDRDSGLVAHLFDERDEAVKTLIQQAIAACKKASKPIGICGQGPSDYPDFAQWLMQQGIDSISLNPDSVISTWMKLA